MRAIQVQVPGGPEQLLMVELPEPVPGKGQVKVRARAIGVGRPDVLIRKGTYKWMPPLPAIPGAELAGVVESIGEEVTDWAPGDRVLVSARELDVRGGCYSEAVVVPAPALFRLPEAIGFADAMSLPNLQLALALMKVAGPPASDKPAVLITGASGGVATMLSQVARHRGFKTYGTSRHADKKAFALTQGFDEVFEVGATPLSELVRSATAGSGVDLVFDHLGAQTLIEGLRSLAALGTLVSYNVIQGPPSQDAFDVLRQLLGKSLAIRCFSMHSFDVDRRARRALMQEAIGLMAAGHVRAPSAHLFALAEVRKTHDMLDHGLVTGKIVMQP